MNPTVPRPVASRSRLWSRSLPALIGGLLVSLAPAPLNWWGFAWVGLIPLWWVVFPTKPLVKPTWQQTQLPLILWSLAYHGLALRWITGLHPLTWMGIPWLGSVAIVAFAWSFITFWGVGSVLLFRVVAFLIFIGFVGRGWRPIAHNARSIWLP